MFEFRVNGGVKFAVHMVQGRTMYWYRWHRLRCIQVFFELFHTILVIQMSIFIDCIVLEITLFIVSEVLLCWCCFYIFLLLIKQQIPYRVEKEA